MGNCVGDDEGLVDMSGLMVKGGEGGLRENELKQMEEERDVLQGSLPGFLSQN